MRRPPLFAAAAIVCAASGATIPPDVAAEAKNRGTAQVLVELARSAQPDLLAKFAADHGEHCAVKSVLPLARVARISATSACLGRIAADPRVAAVEAPATAHVASADSMRFVRHDAIAVVGAGLNGNDPDHLERVVAQACFGDCPYGPESAVTSQGEPGTIDTIRKTSKEGHSEVVDGLNLSIVAVRVADRAGRSLSMADALEAVDWIYRASLRSSVVVLSFETDEVYCAECEQASVGTRALAVYVAALQTRGARVLAPYFGLQTRGAPSCLRQVENFPASERAPEVDFNPRRIGIQAGLLAKTQRYLTSENAVRDTVPTELMSWEYVTEIDFASKERTKIFTRGEISRNWVGHKLRGMAYTLRDRPGGVVLVRPQFSMTCGLPDLVR